MSRMKGHKRGCRCVGCSPATRRKGLKKLHPGRRRKHSSTRSTRKRKRSRGGGGSPNIVLLVEE